MPLSSFTSAFNNGNDQFAKSMQGDDSEFEVIRNGNVGTYMANSIDDLSAASALVPGGRQADISHTLFVNVDVIALAGLKEGTVLNLRGSNVRVKTIHNEGDNCQQIDCQGVGQ